MNKRQRLTILMLPHSIYGYINPYIGIAEILQKRGHRIVFAIDKSIKGSVNRYGFEEIIVPLDQSNQIKSSQNVAADLNNLYLNNGILGSEKTPLEKMQFIYSYANAEGLRHIKDNDKNYKEIINLVMPNVIIGTQSRMSIPSLIKSEIPLVSCGVGNPLSLIDDVRTPPTNSGLPENDQTEWSHFREEYYKANEEMRNDINKWLIEERLTPMNSNQQFKESDYLNIYQYPEELDYINLRPLPSKWYQFDSFMRNDTEEFVFPKQLSKKSGKLILLSMGTIGSTNVEMMRRLIKILEQTQHRYIVSKGIYGDRYDLSDNMWGQQMVPQTKVLPLMDLFITHGGNNAICEAFYHGKPLIVMPLCSDGYDNAQRVYEKGFGLRIDPNKCSAEELINAIDKLLNNKELSKRMNKISQRIQNDAKSDKLANLIESLV